MEKETISKKGIVLSLVALAWTILFINVASAMYGGEETSIYFDFPTTNCTIFPNETEGINFTFQGNEVVVSPALNFVGEFNITCYDWKTRSTSGGSGGGWTRPTNENTKVTTPVYITTDNIINNIITKPSECEEQFPLWIVALMMSLLIIGVASALLYFIWRKKDGDNGN